MLLGIAEIGLVVGPEGHSRHVLELVGHGVFLPGDVALANVVIEQRRHALYATERRRSVDKARPLGGREERAARHRIKRPVTLGSFEQNGRHGELHRLVGEELDRGVRHHGLVARGDAKDEAVVGMLDAAVKSALPERRAHRDHGIV